MIYLQKDELIESYNEAVRTSEEWFKPFNEYERIAGNKISALIAKNMPRVNDGSLAASLIETPMNVLPFMQSGKFKSTNLKKKWVGELANIIWNNKIVPNANTQASFFDKEQIALYRSLKYGAQPRYNFFVSTDKYTGSDWSLPYVKNLKLEPGKFSVDDCAYVFLDIFFTKLQLKNIIAGDSDEGGWDKKALQELVDGAMTSKEMEEQNINERDKAINASGIKLTACFNRGIGAPFYMFSKQTSDKVVREWKNPDPTGDLPITMQYCFENLESPYGIGRVELAGATQNVLDYFTQAHVLATQIGLQPPKKISGSADQVNFNSLTWTPEAIWQTGNANVEVMQTTNSVYTNFPTNYGLYKSQLMNLQGRTDGSVSASSGNPQFSKTSAGVNQQETRTNAQDNYLRSKADSASAKMAEKMMNVHMAQMKGADLLDIAEDDRSRLMLSGYFDENPTTEDIPSIEEIPIEYEALRDTFRFEYDPRPEANDEEKNRWLEIVDIVTSNPNAIPAIEKSGYRFDLGEAVKRAIQASGADGLDKVLVKMTPEETQMMTQQQMATSQIPGQPTEIPTEMTTQEAPQGEDVQTTMDMYGIDENTAMAVMEARNRGYSEEEINNFLQTREE